MSTAAPEVVSPAAADAAELAEVSSFLQSHEARDGQIPEPGAVDAAVEELLRHLSVVQVAFPRFTRHDVVLAGQPVPAGELVLCSLASADRDPRLAPGLDTLDLRRPPVSHLAFGHGVHHCLGAPLARLELRAAFPALLRRLPGLRLDVDEDALRFRQRSLVFGLEELPVRW